MSNFVIGQRYYSEGEPELGLGIIASLEGKTIKVEFPLANEARIYNAKNSPLKRFILKPGDKFKDLNHEEHSVSKIEEMNGVTFYLTETESVIPEMQLNAKIELNSCIDRLYAKNFDPTQFFDLRYQSYLLARKYQELPYKGFIGCNIRLINHQLYVAQKALKTLPVRAMLCDEVGLGKTIESGLILNSLIKSELIERAIIIVPSSLVNQWFVELYKKFSLSFSIWEPEIDLEMQRFVIIGLRELKEQKDLIASQLEEHKWDAFIFDESHQNNYSEDLDFLTDLSKDCLAKILLSATPEVLGPERMFEQLKFLDSDKYNDYEKYLSQQKEAKEISQLIKDENLAAINDKLSLPEPLESIDDATQVLIDYFGSGRAYFRNTRKALHQDLFKSRKKNYIPLDIEAPLTDSKVFNAKLEKLLVFLNENPDEKILIIAHSKALILKIQRSLQELSNIKLAVFHSDQSLLERDRQAAFFADEKGAQLLLCTEIGSEGRNFEFCHNLFLFDLPKVPEQLEQRIGRLDRIGQKKDIQLIIPFVQSSFEETLKDYYGEVLKIFDRTSDALSLFHQTHKDTINDLISNSYNREKNQTAMQSLKNSFSELEHELRAGRNYLVEKNSYHHEVSQNILKGIQDFEQQNPVLPYMQEIGENVGIHCEELDSESVYFVPQDNMYIPSFPGLPNEGISFATSRDKAMARDDLTLLNWESPIAQGALDLMLKTPLGNCTIMKTDQIKSPLMLESIFTLECVDEMKHKSAIYLPLTPIRVLIDLNGADKTKDFPKKFLDQIGTSIGSQINLEQIPQDLLKKLVETSKAKINPRVNRYKEAALEKADEKFRQEIARIDSLGLPESVANHHRELLNQEREKLLKSIGSAKTQHDSIRLILKID
ncbi:MAG: hypothetical protein CME65_13735 [Halobacteriovoraceae bacterium]|nr:hypothetical protein [Halobacteriovoraceae bacterium]|tara:strand:+ start:6818 stop:9469 length:2652 start_codon:yes stop_codon:yes gene_type:complete